MIYTHCVPNISHIDQMRKMTKSCVGKISDGLLLTSSSKAKKQRVQSNTQHSSPSSLLELCALEEDLAPIAIWRLKLDARCSPVIVS